MLWVTAPTDDMSSCGEATAALTSDMQRSIDLGDRTSSVSVQKETGAGQTKETSHFSQRNEYTPTPSESFELDNAEIQ